MKLTTLERFFYSYCCYKDGGNEEKNLKYKFFKAVNKEIDKRLEILDFINVIEQLRLFKKIFLNENQCYMLQNRELHRIIDTKLQSYDEELKRKEKRDSDDKSNLIEYLVSRKNEGRINNTDKLLFTYMKDDIKSDINNYVVIE